MHSSDEKICCGRLRIADKKISAHRLPISNRTLICGLSTAECVVKFNAVRLVFVASKAREKNVMQIRRHRTPNFTTKINSKQLFVQCLTNFYGWVLFTCMHRGSPDSAARWHCASLKLIEFAQRHTKLFIQSLRPSRTIQTQKKTQNVDLVSVFCDWFSLEWMFFNTTCFRSGVKVVTWPEGAQRLGKKPWLIRLFVASRLTGGGKLQRDLIHFGLSNDERKPNEKAKKMEIEGSISYIYVDAWWSIWIGIHNR